MARRKPQREMWPGTSSSQFNQGFSPQPTHGFELYLPGAPTAPNRIASNFFNLVSASSGR